MRVYAESGAIVIPKSKHFNAKVHMSDIRYNQSTSILSVHSSNTRTPEFVHVFVLMIISIYYNPSDDQDLTRFHYDTEPKLTIFKTI